MSQQITYFTCSCSRLFSGEFFIGVFSITDTDDKDGNFLPAYRIDNSVIAAADTVKISVQKFFTA
jgi:hypothetical protein